MAVSTIDALYNGGSEKVTATSTGISVTGTVTATTLQTTAGGTVTTASGNDLNIVYPAGRSLFIKEGSETHVSVDNAGNVGIGISSPTSLLTLGTTEPQINFVDSADPTAYARIKGTHNGSLFISTDENNVAANSSIIFETDTTARMRVDSSGSVFVACNTQDPAFTSSTTGHSFQTSGQGQHSATSTCLVLNRTGSDGTTAQFRRSGTTVGSISVTGSSTAYNTSSDYRLKTDAQPMTGASARVQALNPVNFEWIASGERIDGFLAHEAATVVPESVTGTKDAMKDEEHEVTPAVLDDDGDETTAAVMGTRNVPDYQGIDQSKLVPLLTAALQEALTEIAALKARVTTLEG